MIFLAATQPCRLEVFGAHFDLQPIRLPEVDANQVLVMEGELGRRILQRENKKIQRLKFDHQQIPGFPQPLPDLKTIRPGSRIMVVRGGGIGDVIMCLPALRAMRDRLPNRVQIHLATFESNLEILKQNPALDGVTVQPLAMAQMMGFDFFAEFKDPDNLMSRAHMTDFYLTRLGMDPASVMDKRPYINAEALYDAETEARLQKARQGFKGTIYLNGLASDRLRDLPPELVYSLSRHFNEFLFIIPKGYKGRLREKGLNPQQAANIVYLDTEGSLSGYVTAINTSDLLVTADTSTYHIAAALGKPALALFGPVGSDLRIGYYPTVSALDADYLGQTCQAPCGKSMVSEFYQRSDPSCVPDQKRCPEARARNVFFSPCLASFDPQRVVAALRCIFNTRGRDD